MESVLKSHVFETTGQTQDTDATRQNLTITQGVQLQRTMLNHQSKFRSVLHLPFGDDRFVSLDASFAQLWTKGIPGIKVNAKSASTQARDQVGLAGITGWVVVPSYKVLVISTSKLELKVLGFKKDC